MQITNAYNAARLLRSDTRPTADIIDIQVNPSSAVGKVRDEFFSAPSNIEATNRPSVQVDVDKNLIESAPAPTQSTAQPAAPRGSNINIIA